MAYYISTIRVSGPSVVKPLVIIAVLDSVTMQPTHNYIMMVDCKVDSTQYSYENINAILTAFKAQGATVEYHRIEM